MVVRENKKVLAKRGEDLKRKKSVTNGRWRRRDKREKRDGREFERRWVLLGKQALNKELIEVLRAKKKREEREKSSFFYWQRGRQCVLVKGIKKEEEEGGGASFALLALSGIKGLRHVESSVSESGEDKWERTTKRIMKRNVLRKEIGP
jgi:hypothetical protein